MDRKPYIFYCTDDFGMTETSCDHIIECAESGFINKISIMPNMSVCNIGEKLEGLHDVRLCVHLNFVEGECVGDRSRLSLLVDEDGYFKNTFTGLFFLSLTHSAELIEQIKYEMRMQIARVRPYLDDTVPLFLDSHQHTHMIPALFRAMCEVIAEDGLDVGYLRVPAEPIRPFLSVPSMYVQYLSPNLIKQWTLKACKLLCSRRLKRLGVKYAAFFGIMFSGNMTEERVRKPLPQYIKYAKRHNTDVEVLFHLGYIDMEKDAEFPKDIIFNGFYLSQGRKNEYDAAVSLSRRGVTD